MDKWNVVQIVQKLLCLLRDNWDRFENGEDLDEGVSKVAGRRTEGLEAGKDGVVVTVLKIEWRQVCRIMLPAGGRLEMDFAGRDWSEEEVLWCLVTKLRKEDAT